MTEQGLAVLQGGEWRLFRAESQESESYAPAGTIPLYSGAAGERSTRGIEQECTLAERQTM